MKQREIQMNNDTGSLVQDSGAVVDQTALVQLLIKLLCIIFPSLLDTVRSNHQHLFFQYFL